MIWIADHFHRSTILHRDTHCAGIRTVVRADGAGKFGGSIHGNQVSQTEIGERSGNAEFYYGDDPSPHGPAKNGFGVESFITVPGPTWPRAIPHKPKHKRAAHPS